MKLKQFNAIGVKNVNIITGERFDMFRAVCHFHVNKVTMANVTEFLNVSYIH